MVSYAFLEVALAKHGWHSCDIPGNIAQRNASTKTILIFFITFSVYLFFSEFVLFKIFLPGIPPHGFAIIIILHTKRK